MKRRTELFKTALEVAGAAVFLAIPYLCIRVFAYSDYFPVDLTVRRTGHPTFVFLVLISLVNTVISGIHFYRGVRQKQFPRIITLLLKCNLPNALILPFCLINSFWSPTFFSIAQGIVFFLLVSNLKKTGQRSTESHFLSFLRGRPRLPLYLCFLLFISFALWLYVFQIRQLNRMQLGVADIGYFYDQFENTITGEGFLRESRFYSPFHYHFTPASAFLVPLFALYPKVDFLLITQSVFVAGICVFVFLYSRFVLQNSWLALGCALVAAFTPSLSQISYRFSYAYGGVAIAIPFVILSVLLWEQKRYILFALTALFASLIKESIIPFYIAMGLVEFLCVRQPRGRKMSALLFLFSSVFTVVVIRFILPAFSPIGTTFHMSRFQHLGETPLAIILSPMIRPDQFWPLLFNRHVGTLLALILCGAGLAPILSPRHLAYGSLVLLFLAMQRDMVIKSICFQYQSTFLAATLCALPHGVKRLLGWWEKKTPGDDLRKGMVVVGGMVMTALLMSHFYGLLPMSRRTLQFQSDLPPSYLEDCRLVKELAASIPHEWRVLATHRAATHFLEKKEVRLVGRTYLDEFSPDLVCLDLGILWGQSREEVEEVISLYMREKKYHQKRLGSHFLLMTKVPYKWF